MEHASIMQRWAEHHRDLIKSPRDTDPNLLDELPGFPLVREMNTVPSMQEVKDTICVLHNGKASGPDEALTELPKLGAEAVTSCLHQVCVTVW